MLVLDANCTRSDLTLIDATRKGRSTEAGLSLVTWTHDRCHRSADSCGQVGVTPTSLQLWSVGYRT